MNKFNYATNTETNPPVTMCNCLGPQNGDPFCPCGMNKMRSHGIEPSPCFWDQMSEEDKKRPMMLSCPCPKCSIQC